MEDPVRDIKEVFRQLTATASPDVQKEAVYTYYVPNAGLHHPLSYIEPGILSRESILGLYQWYRVLSPNVSIDVSNIVYDQRHNVLLLDVKQTFHVFFLPVVPMPSRLLVRLILKEEDGLHRIAFQEDFFHPDDLAALVFPPAAPIVRLTLRTFGTASNICAKVSQVLGFWRPRTTGIADERNDKRKCNESSNGRAKNSDAPRLGHESTRVQAKKKGGVKKSKGHEIKSATSSDNVNSSSNQGGGDESISQP
ncbi:hypothetical protein F5887DRAFT_1182952 [Amanita rubescens]|nr:hypothetical protein F5887DRAFT_1182952 [Amanita rubescens]